MKGYQAISAIVVFKFRKEGRTEAKFIGPHEKAGPNLLTDMNFQPLQIWPNLHMYSIFIRLRYIGYS
jgi:hypothetical protein